MGNYDQRDGGDGGKQRKSLRKRHEDRNEERDARKSIVIRTPAETDGGSGDTGRQKEIRRD